MFNWIKSLFSKALRIARALIKAVFTAGFEILLAKLQDIATQSITTLATSNLSNDEKRKAAFEDIKKAAIERAISINDREISLIIETVYNALRNEGVIK